MSTERNRHRDTRAGFTLIELMVVVAIIGLLASIAIPSFQALVIRSKKSERALAVRGIESAIFDYIREHESYPIPAGGPASFIWLPDNPVPPYTPLKKPFDPTQFGWSNLSYQPTGNFYYHYYVFGFMTTNWAYFYIRTVGDLDANGTLSWYYKWWFRDFSGNWYISSEFQTPTGEE